MSTSLSITTGLKHPEQLARELGLQLTFNKWFTRCFCERLSQAKRFNTHLLELDYAVSEHRCGDWYVIDYCI